MILDLSKDGKFVTISAFKTPAGIDSSEALKELRTAIPATEIQFFDGTRLAGKEHLEIAVISALYAFKTGINISRSLAMETLLYASAQRQIDVALGRLGVSRESQTVGVVAFSENRSGAEEVQSRIAQFLGTEMNEALLDDWSEEKASRVMELFDIGTAELDAIKMPGQDVKEAVKKAVIERVALLSTRT